MGQEAERLRPVGRGWLLQRVARMWEWSMGWMDGWMDGGGDAEREKDDGWQRK